MDERFSPQAIWGRELRYYRERAGLTQTGLAELINYSDSLISSIETGQAPATGEFAETADAALNADGALTRTLDWRKGVPAYPTWFIDWLPAEEKAIFIRLFEIALVPGLLQTPDYALAMLGDEADADCAHRASVDPDPRIHRLRSTVLRARREQHSGAISAARRVMYEQLQCLAKLGEAENISIRIVPSKRHRGVRGPFAIATLENGSQVAQTETAFGGVVSTRTEDVTTVTASWEAISSAALPEDMSRDLILKTAEELWKTP